MLFEKKYVVETKESKELNIPRLSRDEAFVFRAMGENRNEMYRRVMEERDRALGAEESERRRAVAAEQWLDDLINAYHTWTDAFHMQVPVQSDSLYLYSVNIVMKESGESTILDEKTVLFPIHKAGQLGQESVMTIVAGKSIFIRRFTNEIIAYIPEADYPEAEISINTPIFVMSPWSYTDQECGKDRVRISNLESRISALERN